MNKKYMSAAIENIVIETFFDVATDIKSPRVYTFSDIKMQLFAEKIIEECITVIAASDPSEKTILHEPYRTIIDNITNHFDVE